MSEPEFSRPIRIDTIGDRPHTIEIDATADEGARLATRFGLVGIARLSAKATLTRAGPRIDADGRLEATVTQSCVATGVDLPAEIDEAFTLRFEPDMNDPSDAEEIELDAGDLDVMGYEGGAIDLGEAAAQTLALALDPFPRAPAADAALREAGVATPEDMSPFAALKALRDGLG